MAVEVTPAAAPPATAPPAAARLAGQSLSIAAALMLCLVAQFGLIGALAHNRDQDRAYDTFRDQLANATAPAGGLDRDGHPLEPGTPVAVVAIPRIGLREVVGEGTSATVLKSGPGHRRDTVLPGQPGVSVVMGRRAAYGGPFSGIGSLAHGDLITVTTGQGKHQFEVMGVRRANDPQPVPPAKGQGRLTLITADGPPYLPSDVLRVDARLLTPAVPAAGTVPGFALPGREQALEGDASALVPLVVWGLLLAFAAAAIVFVHQRVGRWHAWVIGVPVLGALGVTVADQTASLLPNLL
ncbi:peptidase C60, sortase A and B [Amycolatopsis mediterranei S699]|uniref:Peptidase C60, sortase A and B n=2 Tax=Amycolatopsis mediterranei TaxID=33910 RepID=A0A0H3DAW1_AMYMU|nr:sortase [Amycolatopsis mediterranei]ADJ47407.1 peptidase C60, sortase A and B [Amycolatopsis mediterranei U32]AEK44253.1 peptidase C60, sortase A and B [Amycolatopsis mediterranei S699]AFO79118.1 peptidase C60, sortase A and B [Amycolatopsis mediterranei S699]AGT86246.1 peptidase C60, sortase A and B [Amycolatopsis mediterranei RB]KDO12405.1 peptidase C60 [Amycolatopsis mediterranei]